MASNDWKAIRKHYMLYEQEIMDSKPWCYGIDPYAWHGIVNMTHIEWMMWQDIRCEGVVMYPQYPVCGFFVDFGNPVARVAIECDGKQWHDPVLDAKRDAILNKEGWRVYRMTGRDCNNVGSEDDDGYTPSPAEAMLREIAKRHQVAPRFADKVDEEFHEPAEFFSARDLAEELKADIRQAIKYAQHMKPHIQSM